MENSFVLLYLTILLPPVQSKEDLQCVVFTKNILSNQISTLKLLLIACMMCCFVWREIAIASSDLKAMSTSPVSSLSSSSPTYPDMSLLASISAALKLLVSWRSDVSSNGTGADLPVTIDNLWFSLTSWYLSYPKNVWLSLVAFYPIKWRFHLCSLFFSSAFGLVRAAEAELSAFSWSLDSRLQLRGCLSL